AQVDPQPVTAERAGRAADEVDLVRARTARKQWRLAVEHVEPVPGRRHDASRRVHHKASTDRTHCCTSVAAGSSTRDKNTVGEEPRRAAASRAITSRLAPTSGARSVLLMTSRSALVTPGPPLRGTLSPPATSTTKICRSTSPRLNVAVRLSPPLSTSTRSSGPRLAS